jgi:3-carboxy-cis,cis-muconate cycloisomerase
MPATPFDHPLLAGLLGDDGLLLQFSPEAEFEEMNYFEEALARAEAAEGIIPAAAAEAISLACAAFAPDTALVREAATRDGVIVPEYVRQLRQRIGPPHAEHLHFGATSEDIIDTGLVLRLVPVLVSFDDRLGAIATALDGLERRFGAVKLMGRTRMQAALPIIVADRIETWRAPLRRHRERLAEIRPRLLVLQFGGAVGTRDKLGPKGDAVARRLAEALGLGAAKPWHSQRDNLAEFAGWLSLVSGSLGKLGADFALMALLGEVKFSAGGASSAIPDKSNPVRAEILVALARHNAALVSAMHQALVHEQERSGAAWTAEWLALPQMVMATGAGLAAAIDLIGQVEAMGSG